MDHFALALKMRRLAVWLDRACNSARLEQKEYRGTPFGCAYVSMDPESKASSASANWNRIHLCGTEPELRPEGIAQLIENFKAAGITRFFAWVSPGPEMGTVQGYLAQSGFIPRMQWTRYPTLLREALTPAAFK